MLISHFVEGVANDLESLAELGGDQLAGSVRKVTAAASPSLATQWLSSLTQVVAEFNSNQEGLSLELRLVGDDVQIAAVDIDSAPVDAPGESTARIALRLPDDLKSRVEQRATRESVSTNTWIVRALQASIDRPNVTPKVGKHLRGTGLS